MLFWLGEDSADLLLIFSLPLLSAFVWVDAAGRSHWILAWHLRIGVEVEQRELVLLLLNREDIADWNLGQRLRCHVVLNVVLGPTEKFLAHSPVFIYLLARGTAHRKVLLQAVQQMLRLRRSRIPFSFQLWRDRVANRRYRRSKGREGFAFEHWGFVVSDLFGRFDFLVLV